MHVCTAVKLHDRTFSVSGTVILFLAIIMTLFNQGVAADNQFKARQLMLESIRDMALMTEEYTGRAEFSDLVMQALGKIPRHEFVLPEQDNLAYINSALPITHRQTISQPFIVALMTDAAAVNRQSRVLEIGTGSGYQAAVLAELAREVYSIEIIEALSVTASKTLQKLGYKNISLRVGDGYEGWPDMAPFDAILVTAAAESVPQPLLDQLSPGGHLVIPLGKSGQSQMLTLFVKDGSGKIRRDEILPVAFVPLTGDH